MPKVTFVGDSTIDNKIWVGFGGIYASVVRAFFRIKRTSGKARAEQARSRPAPFKPALSVGENVMAMHPDYLIHDHTNDGFTTTDVLEGASRDKVFQKDGKKLRDKNGDVLRNKGKIVYEQVSKFPLEFPQINFSPLVEGEADIRSSDTIVLSIGGNNFREFLKEVINSEKLLGFDARNRCIKREFPITLEKIRKD